MQNGIEGREAPARAERISSLTLREQPRPEDVACVHAMVASSGFFAAYEVEVAVELVQERLARGPASGYLFVFAEQEQLCCGYACYGPIACTSGSYDLYWIVVDSRLRGRGVGRRLLAHVERRVREAAGRRIYIETSSRELYAPSRRFYASCGYREEACLADFYGPGDGKVILSRPLVS